MAEFVDEVNLPLLREQPKRVSKKRLEEIQGVAKPKYIAIYYRPGHGKPLGALMRQFRRDVAVLFSEVMARELGETGSVVIIESSNPEPYKQLLNWMSACVAAGDDIPFPEFEESVGDAFEPILSVMVAASKLHVPEGSLNIFLKKRLYKIARRHIMTLDTVRKIYDPLDSDFGGGLGAELQEIATISIFEGWFSRKLEEAQYIDYMYDLADLRDEIDQLDEDLHNAVDKKREFFKQLREKRRMERIAEEATAAAYSSEGPENGATDWASMNGHNPTVGESMDWQIPNEGTESYENPSMTADQVSSDWNSGAATPTWVAKDHSQEDVDGFEIFKARNIGTDRSVNWADEMNEQPAAIFG